MQLPATCCGVLSLKQGSFVIGVALLCLYSLSVVGNAVTWALLSAPSDHLSPPPPPPPPPPPAESADGSESVPSAEGSSSSALLPLLFGPALALALLHVLFSALLVHGARLERRRLLLVWLVYQAVAVVLGLVGAAALFVLALHMGEYVLLSAVVGVLGGTVGMAYCFVIVLAFRRQLGRLPPPPQTVLVRQPEAVPMVDII